MMQPMECQIAIADFNLHQKYRNCREAFARLQDALAFQEEAWNWMTTRPNDVHGGSAES